MTVTPSKIEVDLTAKPEPTYSDIPLVNSPPENKSFTVKIFFAIDKEGLISDFWQVLKKKIITNPEKKYLYLFRYR